MDQKPLTGEHKEIRITLFNEDGDRFHTRTSQRISLGCKMKYALGHINKSTSVTGIASYSY